ncbi:neurotrimin-like [Aphidius gifuensis]|uniref:neurotrimin-like n=1 Tax=Aphidius gifuensis TaxID=684658 RepID=UPI001CDCDD75|nr:neurotrimin-like [Aphidius gifuensis]
MSRWISCVFIIGVWISSCWSFNRALTTVKTYVNKTVILPCHVENLGVPMTLKWWRDDVQLADSNDPNLISPPRIRMWDNNMSLEISQIQPEDSGQYVCQASRSSLGHITQVHAIEVMFSPSVHSVPEDGDLEVKLGDEVEMACIAKGFPYPSLSWYMKGEEMKLLDERSKLKFRADNRSMSGKYTCIADNGIGEPASATIDLRILYKPEIETTKTWIHASPGIRVQFDCNVTSSPDSKVDWYFENSKINYTNRILKFTNEQMHSLIIRSVKTIDYGYYICKAVNSIGSSEAIIELSGISYAPIFKTSLELNKNTYNFIWEVDSYSPIIEYQFWFRKYTAKERGRDWHKLFIPSGSDAIGPLHSKSFNLTGLATATFYEALILSRNKYGWSKPSKIQRFSTEGAPISNKEHELTYDESAPVVVIGGPALQQWSVVVSGASCQTNIITSSLITLLLICQIM